MESIFTYCIRRETRAVQPLQIGIITRIFDFVLTMCTQEPFAFVSVLLSLVCVHGVLCWPYKRLLCQLNRSRFSVSVSYATITWWYAKNDIRLWCCVRCWFGESFFNHCAVAKKNNKKTIKEINQSINSNERQRHDLQCVTLQSQLKCSTYMGRSVGFDLVWSHTHPM